MKPTAWTPGVVWDGDDGEIITSPKLAPYSHWDEMLNDTGYSPDQYAVVEPVKVSAWDQQGKDGEIQKLWSYRFALRAKTSAEKLDYNDLVREIKKHRPLKQQPTGDLSFLVNIADTQFGKADGDGLKGTIERFLNAIESVDQRIRDLRRIGRKLGTLIVSGLGDILEGCDGNYAAQAFTVEANRREQLRIARRLIRDAIARWSKQFNEVIVLAVPGNHGENRKDGKMYTEVGDNDDVAVFEILAEIFSANPEAYGHIKFIIPRNEIYVVLDISGIITGFVHGHITKGGGTSASRMRNWWQEQAFGEQPIGYAQILFSGHYHHTSIIQYGKKTHIQCPSLDGGSEWFTNLSGDQSPPGMLTAVIGKGAGPGGMGDIWIA